MLARSAHDPMREARAREAALLAAFLLSVTPFLSLAFTTISPDGPYLASWALCLDGFAVLEATSGLALREAVMMGLALGAALLARAFAGALAIATVVVLRRRPVPAATALIVALLCVLPNVVWNAQHQWVNLAFTVAGRHVNEGFSLLRPVLEVLTAAIVLGPCLTFVVARDALRGRVASCLWSALPLIAVFVGAALFERVELYWFFGPYLSLVVAAAVNYGVREPDTARCPLIERSWVVAPSVVLTFLILIIASAPFRVLTVLERVAHLRLHNASLFEMYTYEPLARDVRDITRVNHAAVMTDGYGFSSLFDYHAALQPVVIGYDWQGREARRWVAGDAHFVRLLFVDKEPLALRPDFERQLHLACGKVRPGPELRYQIADLPSRLYSTTWCEELVPGGIRILRWERATPRHTGF